MSVLYTFRSATRPRLSLPGEMGSPALKAVRSTPAHRFFPGQIAAGDLRPHRPHPVCDSNGLARTVGTKPPPPPSALPSALLATVRRDAAAKPLAELDFGFDTDDADGADGCAPAFSGAEWLGVLGMLIVRSVTVPRARNPAARSPTTSARAPRRFEAVPVHTVCATIIERTAAAIGSALPFFNVAGLAV
jgi:hypothetical protein